MISQSMPPIRLGSTVNIEAMVQAYAFTYLSKYSGEAIQPRVNTAFTRAWGADEIQMLAPGGDNNPGACLAYWGGDGLHHLIVAMPGATDFPSYWSLFTGIGYHTVDGCTGSVFLAFRTRAYTMWDRLMANARFAACVADPRCSITFTGFSLGGAMAEILAYRFKAANPSKHVKCIKFGSPRVGTARWAANANPLVQFASIYHDRDPIHYFPQVYPTLNPITAPTEALLLANFQRDGAPWRFQYGHCTFSVNYRNDYFLDSLFYAGQALLGGGVANPWYDHSMGAYRMMFQNYCGVRTDALQYRFNFLEFNDENMFGELFVPGTREWEPNHWLNVTPPADRQPISSDVALIANAPVVKQQVEPILRDTDVGLEGGGDSWGAPVPNFPATLPRRILRQPPVNP